MVLAGGLVPPNGLTTRKLPMGAMVRCGAVVTVLPGWRPLLRGKINGDCAAEAAAEESTPTITINPVAIDTILAQCIRFTALTIQPPEWLHELRSCRH